MCVCVCVCVCVRARACVRKRVRVCGGLGITAGHKQAAGMRELKCQMSGLMPGCCDGGVLCGGGDLYASLWPLRDSCSSEHIPVSWHLFPAVRISSLLISDLTHRHADVKQGLHTDPLIITVYIWRNHYESRLASSTVIKCHKLGL